jgi:geranylgeranyl diphosphate synthase type II
MSAPLPAERRNGPSAHFEEALAYYRLRVLERIWELVPRNRYRRTLYEPMLDYPLREGKALRPSLTLAIAQACGGRFEEALDSAVALEMFHNAFLTHDDVQDDSIIRRGSPTLHVKYGVAVAINVGDAMNMLAMRTLLGNVETIGLERAYTVIREVERMARESAEGQSMELDWVRRNPSDTSVRDYLRLSYKKTCWYTCIAPLRIGALIAGVHPDALAGFVALGYRIGSAFQIQDDVLNLTGDESLYGKEIAGDIAEGKRTIMVADVIRKANARDREILLSIYGKPRRKKRVGDISFVYDRMQHYGSIDFARSVAHRLAVSANALFESKFEWIAPSPHRDFINELIRYMIERRL